MNEGFNIILLQAKISWERLVTPPLTNYLYAKYVGELNKNVTGNQENLRNASLFLFSKLSNPLASKLE